MQEIKEYFKENKWIYLILIGMLLLIFSPYIFNKKEFVLGYDFQYQHFYFYQDFHRLISSGQFPFWSKNLFLGTNFWASKSYYILGDPFSYITLLFPAYMLLKSLMFTYILKLLFAGIFFNTLLTKMNVASKYRLLIVPMYVFCGWSILFFEHPSFLVWHTFLPLLFIGVENVLQQKKYSIFILANFILFISNLYFFWTSSIFLTFYWTIRYYQLKEFKFKQYFSDTLYLIGMYLIGVAMSAFLILPGVLHLLQNSRISSEVLLSKAWHPIIIYLDLIVKSLIAPFQVNELGQMLFNTVSYSTNQLTIYSSALTMLLLPQVFVVFKKKERTGYILLLAILSLLLVTPYGASLMHGFKEPTFRWTLLFIICNLLIIGQITTKLHLINKKLLISTLISILIIIGIILFIAGKYHNVIWDHLKPEYNFLIISIAYLVIYCCCFLFNKKYIFSILLTVLIIELSIGTYKTMNRYPQFENYNYKEALPQDAIQYIKNIESKNSFYRIYVPYTDIHDNMPHNVNLNYDFMSAYSYDSMYQFSLDPFLNKIGIPKNAWQLEIRDVPTLKKLGFKYFIVTEPKFNLGKKEWFDLPYDLNEHPEFKLLKTFGSYSVYEVTDYTPFPIILDYFTDNKIKGDIAQKGSITLPIPYDKGWTLKVNNKVTKVECSEDGFIQFSVAEQQSNIELTFFPNGLKIGLFISAIGFLIFIIIMNKEYKILYKTKKTG